MQEQTITLTQYWQQVKVTMEAFLASHAALPEDHMAKKAARAVISMALEGEKLEGMSTASLMWNGLSIKKRMVAFAEKIGVKNPPTKNYIPVKSSDPAYQDFAKLYRMGLKEFLKVKSSHDLLQQGAPKLGDSGINGAQKEALEDIAAIEANYPEFREAVAVTEAKSVALDVPSSAPPKVADKAEKPAVPGSPEVSLERVHQLDREVKKLAQTIQSLGDEIGQLKKEITTLSTQILSFTWQEEALDLLKRMLGFKSLRAAYQEKNKACQAKNVDHAAHLARYQVLLKQQEMLTSLQVTKKEASTKSPATVVDSEEIIQDVVARMANKGWRQLEKDGSQDAAIAIMRRALVIAKPAYADREAVVAVIVDKVEKSLYQKMFSGKTGMYVEGRGYTARVFGMGSRGETLSQGSLVKAIQQVAAAMSVPTPTVPHTSVASKTT